MLSWTKNGRRKTLLKGSCSSPGLDVEVGDIHAECRNPFKKLPNTRPFRNQNDPTTGCVEAPLHLQSNLGNVAIRGTDTKCPHFWGELYSQVSSIVGHVVGDSIFRCPQRQVWLYTLQSTCLANSSSDSICRLTRCSAAWKNSGKQT